MTFSIAIITCILAACLLYLYKKNQAVNQKQNKLKQTSTKFENSKYHCAIIETGLYACSAVKKIANQPILIDFAPVLPLKGCDISKCDCQYVRRNDRRQENRRSPYPTMADTVTSREEKRGLRDRRRQPQSA